MYPAKCTNCGHSFREEYLPPECPNCLQETTFSRPCWRCKRTFIPTDDAEITCESCQTYHAVCEMPMTRRQG
jgi:DNA-directed RNA polymerase subunit RPC12/RpoP